MGDSSLRRSDAYVLDFPGESSRLLLPPRDREQSPAESIRIAVEALFTAFGQGVIALAFDVNTSYWDEEIDCPADAPLRKDGQGMLVRESLPSLCEPYRMWDVGREVMADLDCRTVTEYASSFVSRRPGDIPDMPIRLTEMGVRTTEVRLPLDVAGIVDGNLAIRDRARLLAERLLLQGDEFWAYGPQIDSLYAPIIVTIQNEQDSLALSIRVTWSIWNERGAGYPDIEAAVERLLRAGWEAA